jgi:hypothetical protein
VKVNLKKALNGIEENNPGSNAQGLRHLEKTVKSSSRTNKASLQRMATGRALSLGFAVSLITSGFVLSANANERKTAIITFDAPGAGTGGPFQGTLVAGINPAVVITGTFTTFDAPGAGTGSGQGSFLFSEAINNAGAIAGAYFDSSNVPHGFLRGRQVSLGREFGSGSESTQITG